MKLTVWSGLEIRMQNRITTNRQAVNPLNGETVLIFGNKLIQSFL
jgi:hypothetical protein